MDCVDEPERSEDWPEKELGFVSTSRVSGPIKYRRFEGRDAGGRQCVFFRVETPSNPDVATEVFDVFREMKLLKRAKHEGGGTFHTGLAFSRDQIHGRVWKVRATPVGRLASDIIDAKLADLARELAGDQGLSPPR